MGPCYAGRVTTEDVIAHWRKGASDALEMARAAMGLRKFDHVLFNCHLAVEKAMKAQYMEEHGAEAPRTHNLIDLAESLDRAWSEQQKTDLDELTDFVVAARYSDPVWAEQYADERHASSWVAKTESLLPLLLP